MWENNRLLLGFCVACGVVASYSLSIYLFIIVIILGIYLFIFHLKTLGHCGLVAANISFTVPSWVKNIITSLMNSYHLSKPLEPEPNTRRDSPYSSNVHLPRRGNCRSSHFTCLDENIDYVNRRNGIGVITPSPTLKNSFSDNLREIRRRGSYESDNSAKIEDFSTTPHVSPWARKPNYNSSEYNNVRRVQTVAGPLLGSSGLSKRNSNDYGLFVDACSPGLASRVVQYREEGSTPSSSVWTHQPQYSSPGQFPMVHLSHSPSTLPVLSPLNSQKASRRSVRVKIAPPDPLGSRLFSMSSKNNSSQLLQTDHSTKSVIETLKEISRKRIHSQLEDNDDDAAKRQKRCGPSDTQSSSNIGEGDNMSKRTREESPRQQEISPPLQPAKRIRNNEILSSLSSSRKLLQSGGVKRKTQNLDWSRCSTPVLGKQLKTTGDDSENTHAKSDLSSKISLVANKLVATLSTPGECNEKSISKDLRTLKEKEKRYASCSLLNSPVSQKPTSEIYSNGPVTSEKISKKGFNSPIDDSPWQKDSPFVTVASPDDVIDDVSALEEKREQDRKSRLLSMMTVISGGEPPLKTDTKETSKFDARIVPPINSFAAGMGSETLPNSSINNNSEKAPLFQNANISDWNSKADIEGSSAEKSSFTSQDLESPSTTSAIPSTSASGSVTFTKPASNTPTFNFGVSAPSLIASISNDANSKLLSVAPAAVTSGQVVATSSLGSPNLLGASQQTSVPVFGSTTLFGSKTTISSEQSISPKSQIQTSVCATTTSSTTGNVLFGFGSQQSSQVTFGATSSSGSAPTPTTTVSSINAVATSPAISTTATSLFQIRPAVSESGKENAATVAVGFSMPGSNTISASPGQTSLFSKPAVGSTDKPALNFQSQVPSASVVFGVPSTSSSQVAANTATTTTTLAAGPFSMVSPASTATASGSHTQAGLFSFGNISNQNPQTSKPMFSGATGGFGQSATSVANSSAPNQEANTGNTRPGGFKFDLSGGKNLFTTSSAAPSSSTNVFGTPVTTSNEPKPLAFGSTKPLENPFATNTANSNACVPSQQTQVQSNPFGTSAVKSTDSSQVKENMFSFGANNTNRFSAPQSSFSGQPAKTTTASSSGFSFQSASSGFASQTSSAAAGFSLPTTSTATPSNTFSTPTTANTAAFSFGSSPAFAPPQQSNMFAFGSTTKTQPETQQGGMFSFGNTTNTAPASGTSMFGQSPASITPVQTQPAQPAQSPTSAFQFGTSSTPQLPGAFNFGASSANPPANNSVGSFSINPGGFSGAAPAMFSIGSGSTAPRVRSARSRRPK